jgi:hypothetical protein
MAESKRLAELRAMLAEAEAAVEAVTEADAEGALEHAAARKAEVEKYLKAEKAKLAKEARKVEAAVETRPAPPAEPKSIFARSVQSVRGTDALTPEEHAARRNPQHS